MKKNMTRNKLLSMAAVCILLSTTSILSLNHIHEAEATTSPITNTCGDWTYIIDSDNVLGSEEVLLGEYTGTDSIVTTPKYLDGHKITGISWYCFKDNETITDVTVSDGIIIIYDVIYVADGAFRNCTSLTSVTLPDSLVSIGRYAFAGCTSLTSIKIPESVVDIKGYILQDCTSLASVTLPDVLDSLGIGVFKQCTSLTSVIIPKGIKSFSEMFTNCTALVSVIIPDGMTSTGVSSFYGCTSLASITLPNSLTSIDYRAFQGCTSLTSITLPDSVISIGFSSFEDCTSLTSIIIPSNVGTIQKDVFKNCVNLETVTILGDPKQSSFFDGPIFTGCSNLEKVYLTENFTGELTSLLEGTSAEPVIGPIYEVDFDLPSSKNSAIVGVYWSHQLSTTPGVSIIVTGDNVSWLHTNDGKISGTPPAEGSYDISVSLSAPGHLSQDQSFTLMVVPQLELTNNPISGALLYVVS